MFEVYIDTRDEGRFTVEKRDTLEEARIVAKRIRNLDHSECYGRYGSCVDNKNGFLGICVEYDIDG